MRVQQLLNVVATISLAIPIHAYGQTFSSGSTGADGALDLTGGSQTIQVPASGVFNYTTVNIPQGQTLSFTNNLTNTPVTMLAQGNVTIAGTINISASQPYIGVSGPGPGGFYGGNPGTPGWGPGGGAAGPTSGLAAGNGQWIGPLSLFPNIGGSGGGGGYYATDYFFVCGSGIPGGGGGGAIITAGAIMPGWEGGGGGTNGGEGAPRGAP